jgi:hypothetical protein
MERKEYNEIYELIGKSIAGEASVEEIQQLEIWINLSDENKKLYTSICKYS